MTMKPSSSMTSVRLTASSPELARRTDGISLFHEHGDEVEAEREVDEVHGFHEPDDQEHDGLEPALRFRLPRGAVDGRVGRGRLDGVIGRTCER